MSVRINACSNSSQSIGLPANCCASASRNFTELDRIYKIYRIEKRRVDDLALIQTILLILSFFLGRGDSFPRGASQIFSDAIENAINETTGFGAAKSFCEFDCFVDRNNQIGRASCRERVYISDVAVSAQK